MLNRLRRMFFSVPVLVAVYLLVLYLVFGFFALPALVKWQAEKQVIERFGLQLQLGEVRFNPLRFEFEANDLRLVGSDGLAMMGFKRLWIDFELRSVVDRAWTFSQIALDSPIVNLSIEKDGQYNFGGLLAQLQAGEPASQDSALPQFVVATLIVNNGQIEISDNWLAAPLIAHVEPLSLTLRNLSSLSGERAQYRLSVRTREGEKLDASGELNLAPFAMQGVFALTDIQVATVSRSLSRVLAIDSSAGRIGLAARFDLGVDDGGSFFGTLGEASLDIVGLSVSAPGAQSPLMASEEISLKQGVIDLTARDAHFASFRMASGQVSAKIGADGSIDWSRFVQNSAVPGGKSATVPPVASEASKADQGKPWTFSVGDVEVADMALRFADEPNRLQVDLASVAVNFAPTVVLASEGVRVSLAGPKMTASGVQLQSGAQSLAVQRAQVDAASVELATSAVGLALSVAQPSGLLAEVALKGSDESLGVAEAKISGDQLAVDQNSASIKLSTSALKLALSKLVGRQADSQIALANATLTTGALAVASSHSGTDLAGINVRVDDAASQLESIDLSIKVVDQADASPMRGAVGAASLGAGQLRLALADGPIELTGEGLQAALSDTVLRTPDDSGEMLRLANASLRGVDFNLKERTVSAETLALADGVVRIWLDAQGRVNGLGRASEGSSAELYPVPIAPASSAEPGWQMALAVAQIDGLSIGFDDRHQSPPIALGLEAISARASGLSTVVVAPIPVEFKARLASGGDLEASGSVQVDNGQSDLAIKVAGVELAPLQPYLSELARLHLASGRLSGAGRLRYADPVGALLSYEGRIAVDQLLLEETEPKRPFVSWDSVASDDLILTVAPNRLDIGELRVARPAGRLIIAEDQSINLTDVLRKDAGQRDDATGQLAGQALPDSSDAARAAAASGDLFPVSIARVRVSDGLLEFADLSLRPQFGTRMHDLKGVITGLGSDPNQRAQIQLDAQVDTYGSARIRGQISVAKPEKLTAIDMNFRNLEMTSLSPYVVKFAGYRVIGGQLTLDLQYRVDASALKGQNKIVLNQVELGEKVESPGVLDLPLDLALAILKDSKGVIDIELPVSGNLNDPLFDYGAVIGKAVGNLLGSIVTAPFRALGALFGGGAEDKLDSVDFEPGSAVIAPHERQKLATVARALKERPALKLIVPPTYAAPEDSTVLKSRAVRGEIVRAMGVELAPDEDPGPVDTANQRVQDALEAVFSQRYAPEVLAVLKQRALAAAVPDVAANAVAVVATEAGEESPAVPTPALAARPSPAFYQTLVDRLLREETVTTAALDQLATQRSDAILAELASLGGISSERIVPGKMDASGEVVDKIVRLRLQLETGK